MQMLPRGAQGLPTRRAVAGYQDRSVSTSTERRGELMDRAGNERHVRTVSLVCPSAITAAYSRAGPRASDASPLQSTTAGCRGRACPARLEAFLHRRGYVTAIPNGSTWEGRQGLQSRELMSHAAHRSHGFDRKRDIGSGVRLEPNLSVENPARARLS